jgi:hypothetical protein
MNKSSQVSDPEILKIVYVVDITFSYFQARNRRLSITYTLFLLHCVSIFETSWLN